MQIDFHHAVTYVLARLADFSRQDAEIIAYSAQYVDDATENGRIAFDNGTQFCYEGAASQARDYRELEANKVWLPFHFLPGNMGLSAGKDPGGDVINKLICRPNSPVAKDMVKACIAQRGQPYALHQLGITLHVYADTWAHQGFAGIDHIVNKAHRLRSNNCRFDADMQAKIASDAACFLEHGAALTYPDQPYLVWEYTNGLGEMIRRDNPKDFLQAADYLFHVLVVYRQGKGDMAFSKLSPMPVEDRNLIKSLLISLDDENGDERHRQWLSVIADGRFSFGKETVTYNLNDFLSSHWKLFHDALAAHRTTVIKNIFPQYQICVE